MTASASTHSSRFPYPIPFGWFGIARIDELPSESVTRLAYFGRELVLWRDGDDVRLVDARCPHLGAHLGVGGTVRDGQLVCPFHGWSFGPDGANTCVPYADRPHPNARLRVYPTVVRNRLLLAWYHPDPAVAPTFDVPDALGDDAVECGRLDFTVATAWQEIAENSVDMAHFKFVHGLERIGQVGELTLDGPFRKVASRQQYNSARGPIDGALESNSFGPGVGITHFDLVSRVTQVSAMTAIDADHVHARFTFYHAGDELSAKVGKSFAEEVRRQFQQDIPIWESKFAMPRPALAPSEQPIATFRKWASQFYVAES